MLYQLYCMTYTARAAPTMCSWSKMIMCCMCCFFLQVTVKRCPHWQLWEMGRCWLALATPTIPPPARSGSGNSPHRNAARYVSHMLWQTYMYMYMCISFSHCRTVCTYAGAVIPCSCSDQHGILQGRSIPTIIR